MSCLVAVCVERHVVVYIVDVAYDENNIISCSVAAVI